MIWINENEIEKWWSLDHHLSLLTNATVGGWTNENIKNTR